MLKIEVERIIDRSQNLLAVVFEKIDCVGREKYQPGQQQQNFRKRFLSNHAQHALS
jgi:hypothetical protein